VTDAIPKGEASAPLPFGSFLGQKEVVTAHARVLNIAIPIVISNATRCPSWAADRYGPSNVGGAGIGWRPPIGAVGIGADHPVLGLLGVRLSAHGTVG